ncbi:MAG TPA: type II toxin-antitoxin system prevent-host-death family antitoxin [Polyangiaceae bacterium]|jgi:prevent-host-death family protein
MAKRVMSAAEFRADCMRVLDAVASARTEVVVTKRGKPVARVVPVVDPAVEARYGALRAVTTVVDVGDDLLSTDAAWTIE